MTDFRHLEFSWPADPSVVARAITAQGCAVVRGLVDPARLEPVARAARARFSSDDEAKRARRLDPALSWQHRFGVTSPLRVFGDPEAVRAFVCGFSRGTPILDVAAAFFGAPLMAEPARIVFRRQAPGNCDRQIPYHQDFYTQTPGVRGVLNFWLPFDACGIEAPSVEVVPHVFERMLETRDMPFIPENASFDKIHITRETIESLCGSACFWHPAMSPGDALIFSDFVVHRTFVTRAMTRERASLEYRVISTASITPAYKGTSDRFIPLPQRAAERAHDC